MPGRGLAKTQARRPRPTGVVPGGANGTGVVRDVVRSVVNVLPTGAREAAIVVRLLI